VSAFHRLVRGSLVVFIAGLAACGGGGGGGGSTPGPVTPPSKIFVGDAGNFAIGSSPNSNPSAGASVVDRVISGSNTTLSQYLWGFALDVANDRLYVSDLRAILVFNNAGTASGNIAPSRVVSTILGGFGSFNGIYLDTVNNRLYAAANGSTGFISDPQQVRVFDNVSTATNAAPIRSFTFASNFIFDIAVDTTKDILYAYHTDGSNQTRISVFANASTRNGFNLVPTRTIIIGESFSSGPSIGIFVDAANDRLYAPRMGAIMVFDSASTKDGSISGTATPTRTINLQPTLGPVLTSITVDLGANRLYAADTAGLNIIPNASTVDGTPPPFIRVLAPGGSVFRAVAVKP